MVRQNAQKNWHGQNAKWQLKDSGQNANKSFGILSNHLQKRIPQQSVDISVLPYLIFVNFGAPPHIYEAPKSA